jgi:hypothetical protein
LEIPPFYFRYLEASKRRSSDKMHFVRCPIPRRKKATSNGASFVGLDGLRVTLKVVSNLFLTQQISSWRGSGIGINEEGIDKKTQQAQELSLQAFAAKLTKESILDFSTFALYPLSRNCFGRCVGSSI